MSKRTALLPLALGCLIGLASCAGIAPILGLATTAALDGVRAGVTETKHRLDEKDGSLFSLTGSDWGAIGGAVLAGIIGLDAKRNRSRKKALASLK